MLWSIIESLHTKFGEHQDKTLSNTYVKSLAPKLKVFSLSFTVDSILSGYLHGTLPGETVRWTMIGHVEMGEAHQSSSD